MSVGPTAFNVRMTRTAACRAFASAKPGVSGGRFGGQRTRSGPARQSVSADGRGGRFANPGPGQRTGARVMLNAKACGSSPADYSGSRYDVPSLSALTTPSGRDEPASISVAQVPGRGDELGAQDPSYAKHDAVLEVGLDQCSSGDPLGGPDLRRSCRCRFPTRRNALMTTHATAPRRCPERSR